MANEISLKAQLILLDKYAFAEVLHCVDTERDRCDATRQRQIEPIIISVDSFYLLRRDATEKALIHTIVSHSQIYIVYSLKYTL